MKIIIFYETDQETKTNSVHHHFNYNINNKKFLSFRDVHFLNLFHFHSPLFSRLIDD